MRIFCMVIVFLLIFACITDAWAVRYVGARQSDLDTRQIQTVELARQLTELQEAVRQRSERTTTLYRQVLAREGRLTEKHIVNGAASRLVAAEQGNTGMAAGPSRSFSRYSPYQFDVTVPSAVTAYELEQVFTGTPLQGLGRSFIQAELLYGINAAFLAALAIHESHWGSSAVAQDKNNLFGFGAFDDDPYRHASTFSSRQEGILSVARFLRQQYIGGEYAERNIAAINQRYAADPEWNSKVFSLMLELERHICRFSPP